MRTAAVAAAALLVVAPFHVAPTQAAPSPVFQLPAPTGRYPIGTTTWRVIDASRAETFGAPGEYRNIEVFAWYPAAAGSGSPPASYLREGLVEVRSYTKLLRVAEDTFDAFARVRTHATVDAALVASPRRLPVLVFSGGFTGIPSYATALLEELASRGYIVLNIVHPYELTAATLADGRVVSMLDTAGAPRPAIREVFDEWGPEDATVAAVTSAASRDEQLRLLRGYLNTLTKTTAVVRRWVADTKVVLDQWTSLPATSRAGELAGRADLARLGVFGHSMGGVVAGQFCVDDRRCRAGLNLDGIPQYGTMIDRTLPHAFLMVYSARPGRLGANDPIYRRAARTYYRVDVAGTRHLDFSDMTFWGGPLRERPVLGTIPPERVAAITRTVVREFFDQELLGRRSPLLAGTEKLPEVAARKLPR
jgi:predicted dienelactone hydrolase